MSTDNKETFEDKNVDIFDDMEAGTDAGGAETYGETSTGELEGSFMEEASEGGKEPSSKKDKKKDKSDEKASKALKTVGIFSILLAFLGLAAIGVFTYYMAIAPYYDKNGESYELNYPVLATDADADTDCKKLEMMQTPTDASATDAEAEGEVE